MHWMKTPPRVGLSVIFRDFKFIGIKLVGGFNPQIRIQNRQAIQAKHLQIVCYQENKHFSFRYWIISSINFKLRLLM